jgi:phosphopantothenoylcysteine decarboxylase
MPTPELPSRSGSGSNVLLCVTGSVATVRVGNVYRALLACAGVAHVVVAATPAARRFDADPPLPPPAVVLHDDADWAAWRALGDPVLHIALRDWADALVVAPLSANSLAKLAAGLCDNLVTCVARAWPVREKPFVVAPAMNTAMWNHPLTAAHLATLRQPQFGVTVVPPVEKTLACGDTGVGAMASPEAVATAVARLLALGPAATG